MISSVLLSYIVAGPASGAPPDTPAPYRNIIISAGYFYNLLLIQWALYTFNDCIQEGPNTFWPRVPQFWQNNFGGSLIITWKNWDLALQNFFWSLECVKNAKNVKIVKNQVFEGIVAISPKRYGQFLWFFGTKHLWP